MNALNLDAVLWVVVVLLWIVAFVFFQRSRREKEDRESAYPRSMTRLSYGERRLAQAGISTSSAGKMQVFCSRLLLSAILPLLASWIAARQGTSLSPAATVLLALCGFLLHEVWLYVAARQRKQKLRSGLSFYLDVVVALLRAGLPVQRSLFQASRDAFSDPHPLADEMARVENEILAGKDRSLAFYGLADRTGLPELRTLAAAIHVALDQGASIEHTLRMQADVLRDRRREEAIRRINASAAASFFPIVLCGVPIFAVLVYFPAFLDIFNTLRSLRLFN